MAGRSRAGLAPFAAFEAASAAGAIPNGALAVTTFARPKPISIASAFALGMAAIVLACGIGIALGILIEAIR